MSRRPYASRHTPLDDDRVVTLLARVAANTSFPEQQRLLVRTVHAAGLRPGEAAALTVGCLDARRCALRVVDAKTGTVRVEPVPARLYRELARATADADPAAPLFGDSVLRNGQPCDRRTQLVAANVIAASVPTTRQQVHQPTLHDLRLNALGTKLRDR